MSPKNDYDVIIIGGSYAGLAAGLALSRALRKILIIDSGKPCNRFTPYSHNFITHDGQPPQAIAQIAKTEVLQYGTATWVNDSVSWISGSDTKFRIETDANGVFTANKIILATGVKDIMPDISGFAACWGVSILHCPYCHGYEVRGTNTGILLNGDMAFEFAKMIDHWAGSLTLFTNGPSSLSPEQHAQLSAHDIEVVEKEIVGIHHEKGQIRHLQFNDGSIQPLEALYAKLPLKQQLDVQSILNCSLNENGLIQIDEQQRTSIPGIYAAGDNSTMFRSVTMAAAAGHLAGAMLNRAMIEEAFTSAIVSQ